MSDPTNDLARALDIQGRSCALLGSPFTGGLLGAASRDAAAGDPLVTDLFAPWAGKDFKAQLADAAPLRLAGALHDLVLEGAAPELAAAYPRPGGDADGAAAWAVARRTFGAHRERVAAFMTHEPQTNEVRRSACLLGGFLEVAHATGLPLRCFEIAASAGLNLSWDQYRYELGSAAWGPEGAPVVIDAEWRGETPPVGAAVRVVERAACDRRPVVLSDPAERRRLLAYVWPDQFERLARIRAAIGLALANGVKVEAADAVDWAAARAKPTPGAASVLYHSIFWQYMPPDSQAALARVIADLGAQATADAPFAWVRMEPPPADMTIFELRMTLWPGGEDRRLGLVHPHGAWADWGA